MVENQLREQHNQQCLEAIREVCTVWLSLEGLAGRQRGGGGL